MMCFVFVFFFKQKTAYEMRISDWSSDVCSSDLERDLIEGQLVLALAGDIGERDRLVAQIFVSQRVHVVAVAGGIQHVALQHGVVRNAREHVAVACEHIDVVFQVLADFRTHGVFERSDKHTSELQSLMRTSYAVFSMKNKIARDNIL